MAKRRLSERHIFFPWERRGGLLRRIRIDQARPILFLGFVLTVVFYIGMRERRASGVRRTRATILTVREAVDSYMADHDGGCPPGGTPGLGNYAPAKAAAVDAWGKPLRLSCPGRDQARYELSSDGPDGKPGGLDRIE
jgi:general secretion pathway protein G